MTRSGLGLWFSHIAVLLKPRTTVIPLGANSAFPSGSHALLGIITMTDFSGCTTSEGKTFLATIEFIVIPINIAASIAAPTATIVALFFGSNDFPTLLMGNIMLSS